MFYQNFINIKQQLSLSDTVYEASQEVFKHLKPSDTLTTGVYARKTRLPFEFAEQVLIECVNQGVLDILIIVPCHDPHHPPLEFGSIKEFTKASMRKESIICPYCEEKYEFDKAYVAFRRPDVKFPVKVQ
ncbi:hypothetical protein O3V59_05815 [Brevibacillus thermoruber]|uniref:Uncharacterized protein n=1 Tax=Brevibacillus thermoruber TaxID=33942 RepID=A0A9X3Z2K3_9BACL|nr:hypothetical protein [Brevibacillus thermoruber]MDA5107866.1 hypothetical protein [Brevibacillus thermoruber]